MKTPHAWHTVAHKEEQCTPVVKFSIVGLQSLKVRIDLAQETCNPNNPSFDFGVCFGDAHDKSKHVSITLSSSQGDTSIVFFCCDHSYTTKCFSGDIDFEKCLEDSGGSIVNLIMTVMLDEKNLLQGLLYQLGEETLEVDLSDLKRRYFGLNDKHPFYNFCNYDLRVDSVKADSVWIGDCFGVRLLPSIATRPPFEMNERVRACSNGILYEAEIVEATGGMVKVHYVGCKRKYDEWLEWSAIRRRAGRSGKKRLPATAASVA